MEKMFGVMIDCSRSAVMNVATIKNFANILKRMGYNTIMLYTEDTYEVDNQPLFGHLRGKYTKAEMKEIDAYCDGIGIEVIPCIQTLAHLENMFKWKEYEDVNDCDEILLAGEEKTYKLIEDMISTLSSCFKTNKIHIGMDEAYRVGTGKYQELHGAKDRFDIINNHLHKVCEIAAKYGYEPMVWSDMFCKLAFDIKGQYDEVDASKILEKAALPENVSLVYWDYYNTEYDHYVNQIKTNRLFGKKVYFAGGAWTWKGFAPDNDYSIKTTAAALKACNDCGVDGIFFTMWGDNGSECSKFAVLPSLMYAAEAYKGNTDTDSIKAKFKDIVGCDYDSFMLLDKLDTPVGESVYCVSKYLLYNDCFTGLYDYLCSESDGEYYAQLAKDIDALGNCGEYSYMFDFYKKLAEVLSIKAPLGIKTRAAYLNRDMKKLSEIIGEYEILVCQTEELLSLFRTRWYKENKTFCFEVHEIRLGGLIARIKSCKMRLEQLVAGEINEIPELDEPVYAKEIKTCWWPAIASPNAVSGM